MMGAWGTSLYANDTACDIKDDYIDKLKRGKDNEETVEIMMKEYSDVLKNEEEAPLFWFALANIQWDYGRLLPIVKEKALSYLKKEEELERWKNGDVNKLNAWLNTLNQLECKLNSPMPKEKVVRKYRFYQCSWKLGDVFAYQFKGEQNNDHYRKDRLPQGTS